MIGINMKNIESVNTGNFARPKAGGYVIEILRVNNNTSGQKLEIEFDIHDGEFAGYYKQFFQDRGWWSSKLNKSYKGGALKYFKSFIEAVVASNDNTDGLVIGDYEDIDETKLVGLLVGMVAGEKEHLTNSGIKIEVLDLSNAKFIPVDDIKAGNYTVPKLKKLDEPVGAESSAGVVDLSAGFHPVKDDEIPF